MTGTVDVERAVFAALSVLVMGYPCAVGIAAPLSIVRGPGEAADQGIIVRTGEAFQALRQVGTVVFDKTGTLTEGPPALREVLIAGTAGEDEMVGLAASVEASSEHPLARAVVDAALDRGIGVPGAEDFESVTGQGVVGRVGDRRVVVGRPSFLEAHGIDAGPLTERMEALEASGRTVVAVGADGSLLGALALSDEIRSDAAEAVAALRQAGLVPVLVTGDNPRAAALVAARVGIDVVHAGVLPGAKADIVRGLQRNASVAMVGDGINDAPALMQANVGVAMGGGTDVAMESADVIVMSGRLTSLLVARDISARSYRTTRQNVELAFAFNGLGIPLAATGLLYPVWAIAAMAVSFTPFSPTPCGHIVGAPRPALQRRARRRPSPRAPTGEGDRSRGRVVRIGEAADAVGVNPKTIRYYEDIGILPVPERTPAGYRDYAAIDVDRLVFIKTAPAWQRSPRSSPSGNEGSGLAPTSSTC